MKQLNFSKDEVIIQEGEISQDAFILLDGIIAVTKTMADGSEKQLALLEKNAIFGETGLVDTLPRTATCKAHTNNVVVGVVTKENYAQLVKHKPEAILPILRIVTERMRNTLEFVDQLYGEQLKK
jgi:CRP-like cAMP-binding protein